MYWVSQIIGSLSIGFMLDQRSFPRRARAFSGWLILLCMVFIVHTWAFFYQRSVLLQALQQMLIGLYRDYTRASTPEDGVKMDFYFPGYASRLWLFIFCGFLDSMWQTTAYWIIGAMSNDPAKLAHFTGFYKSLQSAGAAGVWRADAVKLPYIYFTLHDLEQIFTRASPGT